MGATPSDKCIASESVSSAALQLRVIRSWVSRERVSGVRRTGTVFKRCPSVTHNDAHSLGGKGKTLIEEKKMNLT